jgi:hypothetical protein
MIHLSLQSVIKRPDFGFQTGSIPIWNSPRPFGKGKSAAIIVTGKSHPVGKTTYTWNKPGP